LESSVTGKMKNICICSFTAARITEHTGVKSCQQFIGNIYKATMKEYFFNYYGQKRSIFYSHVPLIPLVCAKALYTECDLFYAFLNTIHGIKLCFSII